MSSGEAPSAIPCILHLGEQILLPHGPWGWDNGHNEGRWVGSQVPAEAGEHTRHLMRQVIPVRCELGWKHGGEQCLQGAEQCWVGTKRWKGCKRASHDGCHHHLHCKGLLCQRVGNTKDNIQVVDVASSNTTSICVRTRTFLGMTITLRAGELQVTGENE